MMRADRPAVLPSPKTQDPWDDMHFRQGWETAERQLAALPHWQREQVAREVHALSANLPVDAPLFHQLGGVSAWLTYHHDG